MIIELVGLPGGGKTALANALNHKGAVVTSLRSRFSLILNVLQFEVAHPFTAFAIATTVVLNAPKGMRYSLYVNGYLQSAAKFVKARRLSHSGKVAVIDQGFAQLIISLGGLTPSIIKALPKPDVLAIVSATESVRQERMQKRGRVPRREQGDTAWEAKADAALQGAMLAINAFYPKVVALDGEKALEENAMLLLCHPRPRRFAPFAKQCALWLSSLFALIVPKKGIPVLMYHAVDASGWRLSIPPEDFAQQMYFLKRNYTVVPLSDVVAYAKGEKALPKNAVAITFDDGYADLIPNVLPVLEREGLPATLFLTTDVAESTNSMKLPRVSWDEVRTLQKSGFMTIESHGRTHPHLTRVSEEEVTNQLVGAKEDIKRELGIMPPFFAYPFGSHSTEVEAAVSAAAYEAAFTINEGFVVPHAHLLQLPRIQVDATMTPAMFRARLTSALLVNRKMVDLVRAKRVS